MTELSKAEQELNKKLAEWAGWHWEVNTDESDLRYPVLLAPNEELEKDFKGYISNHTPDFTQSLDACFEWLVPKLYSYHLATSFIPDPKNPAGRIPFVHCASVDNDKGVLSYRGFAESETPAFALCLAILKLIGKEKLNE